MRRHAYRFAFDAACRGIIAFSYLRWWAAALFCWFLAISYLVRWCQSA